MLLRYGTTSEGDVTRRARIYTREEHGISAGSIDPDAVWAIRRLAEAGHRAYIVGGAIRDLLLGGRPKDFDVATDAQPNRIRRIFRRSRIIGRRFRLVHLYFENGKIIEVSTFRAAGEGESSGGNNIYGTLAEDVMRRDYSLNALFYDPVKEQLIDYVDGLRDIRKRRLRILTKPSISFAEDPVRMLRAVKYSAPHNLRIPLSIRMAIRKHKGSLLQCSPDRLTEEFNKITASGHSAEILTLARKLGVFDVLFPRVAASLSTPRAEREFFERLQRLDAGPADEAHRADALLAFFGDVVRAASPENTLVAMQAALKQAAEPLRLNNKDTLAAAHVLSPPKLRRHGEQGEGGREAGAEGRPGRSRRRHRRRGTGTAARAQATAGEPAAEATAAPGERGQDATPAGEAVPKRRRRRRRRGGQRSVDMRASKDSTFSP